MRVLHISNFASHHQIPLGRAIVDRIGESNYRFAALGGVDAERVRMGWEDKVDEKWVLEPWKDEEMRREYEEWWTEADVVLCGERLLSRMSDRISHGKLCFYMSERWFKPPLGSLRLFWPGYAKMAVKFAGLSRSSAIHYLAVGPYAAAEFSRVGLFTGRMWRWGYFTAPIGTAKEHRQGNALKVLWAGRMLAWKRVDVLIDAVEQVNRQGQKLTLTLVGDGPEKVALLGRAERALGKGGFCYSPSVSASQIPSLMREHDVFVLPSAGSEGWGAVVNEAMSCGLVVAATDCSGAAATMILSGVNGILFAEGDCNGLAEHLTSLAVDATLRDSLARAGRRTVTELWSPEVAAARLVDFSDALLTGQTLPVYSAGPLASAWNWKGFEAR